MTADGVKTSKAARSQRNKIVTALTTIATSAIAVEQSLPGVVPPGVGQATAGLAAGLAVLVNIFWKK